MPGILAGLRPGLHVHPNTRRLHAEYALILPTYGCPLACGENTLNSSYFFQSEGGSCSVAEWRQWSLEAGDGFLNWVWNEVLRE